MPLTSTVDCGRGLARKQYALAASSSCLRSSRSSSILIVERGFPVWQREGRGGGTMLMTCGCWRVRLCRRSRARRQGLRNQPRLAFRAGVEAEGPGHRGRGRLEGGGGTTHEAQAAVGAGPGVVDVDLRDVL